MMLSTAATKELAGIDTMFLVCIFYSVDLDQVAADIFWCEKNNPPDPI